MTYPLPVILFSLFPCGLIHTHINTRTHACLLSEIFRRPSSEAKQMGSPNLRLLNSKTLMNKLHSV